MKKQDKNQLRILIIEDDLIIAENLRENLLELGYANIDVAADSTNAIETYRKAKPDICLVDIQLTGSQKDGIETMEFLNAGTEVPLIYLTSFADEGTRERAKKTNPTAYLIKPASKTQVDISIDIALNNFFSKKDLSVRSSQTVFYYRDYIFLKQGDRYEKYYHQEITYIKAEGSYTHLYTADKTPMVSMHLQKLVEHLSVDFLIRCHRSYVVNIHHVHSFDQNYLYVLNGQHVVKVPIGDQYRVELNKKIPKI